MIDEGNVSSPNGDVETQTEMLVDRDAGGMGSGRGTRLLLVKRELVVSLSVLDCRVEEEGIGLTFAVGSIVIVGCFSVFTVDGGSEFDTIDDSGFEIISSSVGFRWLMDPPLLAETPLLQNPPIPSTSLRATLCASPRGPVEFI